MLDRQLKRLREEWPDVPAPLTLRLLAGEGDPTLGSELEGLARRVSDLVGDGIEVRDGSNGVASGPALALEAPGRGRVYYRAMPDGLEAEPFVDLLLAMAQGGDGHMLLDGIDEPVDLVSFVSPFCPHCARSVRSALEVALASPLVTVEIVDATRFPERAARYRVKSVPVTLLDGGEGITGAVSTADLVGRIRARGQPDHETAVFASWIEAGRFPDATGRVLRGDGARWFAAVWLRGTLTLRLGLLVAAEIILEEDPRALDGIVETVLPVLDDAEPGPRGDTADLLGKIAHPAALEALRAHADDGHPDVAEAVMEAIAAIEADPGGGER